MNDRQHIGAGKGRRFWAVALSALLCVAPVVAMMVVLLREVRDLPFLDDYLVTMYFVVHLAELPSRASQVIWIVAAQQAEYKLIFEHSIMAVDYALTGAVHPEMLAVLGDLLLLGFLPVFWVRFFPTIKRLDRKLLLFGPLCLLVFQLNYVETLDWAMCGLQTVPVVLFSMLALHLLLKQGRRSAVLACAAAVVACFGSANGFLLLPVGLLACLPQRRWRLALAWTASLCGALALYLYRFRVPHHVRSGPHASILQKTEFFVRFVGGAVESVSHAPLSGASWLLGLVILVICVHAVHARTWRHFPFLCWAGLWCLITAAVVAQGRADQGVAISLSNRYKIYSDLLMAFCYVYVAESLASHAVTFRWKRFAYLAAVGASLLLNVASGIYGQRFLANRRERVALGMRHFVSDPERNTPEISLNGLPFGGPEPQFSRAVLLEAIQRGIYHLPPPRQW